MTTNYAQNIPDNLIAQYQESPIYIAFLQALATEADIFGGSAQGVITGRVLQTGVGIQLDVIGSLVGASRLVTDTIIIEFFGYSPDVTALGFTDLNDPSVGGRYRAADENTESTRALSDPDYRLFILGTIYKNATRVTGDEIIEATKNIFGLIDGVTPEVTVVDGNMYFYVLVGRPLSPNDQLLIQSLNLIPKPIGIRGFFVSYAPDEYFGFSEDPNALGFADLGDPTDGGELATLFDI